MTSPAGRRNPFGSWRRAFLATVAVSAGALNLLSAHEASAQEPAACLSMDMSQWPAPSKPYFMIVADNSGSMTSSVTGTNSCGYQNNRTGHLRCAIRNTVNAFAGEVNFGLSTYTWKLTCPSSTGTCANCGGSCFPNAGCSYDYAPTDNNWCGPRINEPTLGATNVHAGGLLVVPVLQDHYWVLPPDTSNVPGLLGMVDNGCGNGEIGADSNTPIGGALFNMNQYFSGSWRDPFAANFPNNTAVPTPIGPATYGGNPAERPCRSINIILITDGDETCDSGISPTPVAGGCRAGQTAYLNTLGERLASYEADRLYTTGVTVSGQNFKVRTYVIGFAGANATALNHIATCGGTGASYSTANETQLSQALANIVGGSVKPETCDNTDNNCNGCTDEGYTHYCDVRSDPPGCCTWKTPAQKTACGANACTCCSWATPAERVTCLNNYTATIWSGNPNGDLTLLPCTTVTQQTQPANWLCYDPKETCDNVDNNCSSGADEGVTKCGTPLHCPQAETCNGDDDDCNGLVDDGNVCGTCTPSAEVCDGCDNDCDGFTDNGVSSVPCGLTGPGEPAYCAGTLTCKAPQAVPKGTCVAGGGWNTCNNDTTHAETCDGLDNNCDGIIDDGVPSIDCVPAGTPAGLVYGGTSQCKMGKTACSNGTTTCVGFVGPSSEVCDLIDNNCDGTVDNGAFGAGLQCGVSTPPCSPGLTACVNGALVCQGGIQPQAEVCDGVDNNCNGQSDESPLADGPAAGANGCWTNAGSCCTFSSLSWCPPAGATCNANGALTAPCNKGTLTCSAGAWSCLNPKGPSTEVCDNVDNNCDGTIDNGIAQVGQTCGSNVGECTAGAWQCANGLLTCAGAVSPTPEVCDTKDNNCDGAVDNGIQGLGQACGNATPPCAPGSTACVAGQVICQGGTLPQNEICDGIDNNCDGQTDNAPLSDAPGAGLTGCWALPGNCCTFGSLHWCPPPGGTCTDVGTLSSPCSAGALQCTSGGWGCAGSQAPGTEVCDGIDNNCNGQVDDVPAVDCVPAGTPAGLVYGGTSQCKKGTKTCGACSGFVGPSQEICDGIDNDCDGVVDNAAVGTGTPCGINKPPCTLGTTMCVNGALACQGGVQPQPEICDGIDNNCNGSVDEAPLADAPPANANGCWNLPGNTCTFGSLHWTPPPGATCNDVGTLSPPCSKGLLQCVTGAWACQGSKTPGAEVCDNIDNNCDGTVDNGIPQVGQTCGVSVGECEAGVYQCANGVLSCPGSVGPTLEVCNGKDDNCDGLVDNAIQGMGVACGNATPPCTAGLTACVGGQVVCQGGTQPTNEICDGIDNNCDGQVDNPPLVDAPQPGQSGCWDLPGSCCSFGNVNWCPPAGATCNAAGTLTNPCSAGMLQCTSGAWSCNGAKDPSTEVCDSVDNNCNGAVDDMPAVECVPAGTSPTLVYGGTSQCKKGLKTCGNCAGFVGPTPETCDGIDNDCNGIVDDSTVGEGTPCGFSKPPCTLGATACVNGALTCLGGVQPEPEVCDGIDNNCNGSMDEAPLADAPPAGQNGCWNDPGACCTFANLSWCPPAGAACSGNGTLSAPCNRGFLSCAGATGWTCLNPKGPGSEICDGVDNNCNNAVDDGVLPGTGDVCGQNVGECKQGTIQCTLGVLTCDGSVTPTDEVCDGLDNNCNGQIDDGIPTGGPCTVPYDTAAYPGDRSQGACQLGVAECDGNGGLKCLGGIGPQPELCDGIDNDCDGLVDEDSTKQASSSASDVIDGTDNPTGNPAAKIGDSCGDSVGACKPGAWACRYGVFACLGGKGPEPEQCDCDDNDCDGVIDNQNDVGEPPLCGTGKQCVTDGHSCQCAAPCKDGEFPCAGGQDCASVNLSETGDPLGKYCIQTVDLCGGDCTNETIKDANDAVLCAPAGTDPAGCNLTPVCACVDQYTVGCSEPCFNVTCGTGETCPKFGPNAGKCVTDTCWLTGCSGCNQVCNLGSCVENPCQPDTCKSDEVCKPNATFTDHECLKSCAGVACQQNQTCQGGECIAWCDPPCEAGYACDPSTLQCVADKCAAACADGACCDPLSGECGNCPCEGVLCPPEQKCEDGQCWTETGGTGGTGGSGGTGGTGGSGGSGATGGSGGSGGKDAGPTTDGSVGGAGGTVDSGPPDKGVWGLATGGGGCACRMGASSGTTDTKLLLLAGLAAAVGLSRRRSRKLESSKGGAR